MADAVGEERSRPPSFDLSAEDPDEAIVGKVAGYYHQVLHEGGEARRYLASRGLDDDRLVARFRLGHANRTLGLQLPPATWKVGKALRARLQALGVIRESGHEHLCGCLVVPVTDGGGRVVQLYGRKIGERLRAGTPLHMTLSGTARPFHLSTPSEGDELVVVGSVLDALTLWLHGQRDVVAVPDGGAAELRAAVERAGTRKVLLAFARTRSGEQAARAIVEGLAGLPLELGELVLPKDMDVNALCSSVGDPAEALAALRRHARWIGGKPALRNVGSAAGAASAAGHGPVATVELVAEAASGQAETEVARDEGGDELVLSFDDRRWRLRGLAAARARGTLRLNVLAERDGVGLHVDVFDLYSARHRSAFVRVAAGELGLDERVVKRDLGRVLLRAEEQQHELLCRLREPEPRSDEMGPEERAEALALLSDPDLVGRIGADLDALGLVGETEGALVAYLAATSRKLAAPLAVVVQSSAAAGKSRLMQAVAALVPDEERVSYAALTGQSLYYMGGSRLRHKLLCLSEQAGAEQAAYSLKLLQSEGAITIASTGKDPSSGRLVAQEYRAEGPVAILTTTTSVDVDEELLSRCIVLAVDESAEQTRRIHAAQRRATTLDGLLARRERERVVRLHQNAQRLLEPLAVVNPFAARMGYADLRVRARRDQPKLLALVEVLALLHQHQRERRRVEHAGAVVEYVEAAESDIETARRLGDAVGLGVRDDLAPATRSLAVLLDRFATDLSREQGMAREELRFTRRQVRERLGLGGTRLWVHLGRLVEGEYVLAHRAPHGRGNVYSVAFEAGRFDYDEPGSRLVRGSFAHDSPLVRTSSAPTEPAPTHRYDLEKGNCDVPTTPRGAFASEKHRVVPTPRVPAAAAHAPVGARPDEPAPAPTAPQPRQPS